jgi:hypothetical protein
VAGFLTLETLSGWGARYPEKKARSKKSSLTEYPVHGLEGREFCVIGSRVLRRAEPGQEGRHKRTTRIGYIILASRFGPLL